MESQGFDYIVTSYASNIDFDHAGLDLVVNSNDRTGIRENFCYFSGEDPAQTPGQVSINECRCCVILVGQPGPDHFKVAYLSSDFSTKHPKAVRTAINALAKRTGIEILPPSDGDGPTDRFERAQSLDSENPNDAILDADDDGSYNIDAMGASTAPCILQSRLAITQ